MSYIETFTGRVVNPFDLSVNDISIIDIAHALSHTCRFGGHCKRFYSVAEHSILVSEFATDENKFWGLMHDATEAYFGDLPKPIKRAIPKYCEFETAAALVISEKYGLPSEIPEEVHVLDKRLLLAESYQLMEDPFDFGPELKPLALSGSLGMSPEKAKNAFLLRFKKLFAK